MTAPILTIIGNHGVFDPADLARVIDFHADIFRRTDQIPNPRQPLRHMRFDSPNDRDVTVLHLFGVEVETIDRIPDGMTAWQLTDDSLLTYQRGGKANPTREPLTWTWLEQTGAGERPVGEFRAAGCEFRLSANAYASPAGQTVDEVEIADYDPAWPDQFRRFADQLADRLSRDVALNIEHIGSTAVPGLPAKPIIDVLVETPSLLAARRRAIPRLNRPRWEYWWHQDHPMFIRRDPRTGRRTHHVHLAPAGCRFVRERLAFRDHLRRHPDDAARYADLKRRLAARLAHERERYHAEKNDFIQTLTAQALRDQPPSPL